MNTKLCTMCGEHYPANLEFFYKQSNVKSGLSSRCKKCTREVKRKSNKRIAESDPDGWAERRRRYVDSYKKRNPERVARKRWQYYLKSRFNITPEQYLGMYESQGGVCAACGRESNGADRRLSVDHDHSCCPGKKSCGKCVRGLLCGNCNTALGLLGEDLNTIEKIANYIKEHNG